MDIESTDAAPLQTPLQAAEGLSEAQAGKNTSEQPEISDEQTQPALIVHLPRVATNENNTINQTAHPPTQTTGLERKKRSTSGNKMQLLNPKLMQKKAKQTANSASKSPKPKQSKRTTSATSASKRENPEKKPKGSKNPKVGENNIAPIEAKPDPLVQTTAEGTKSIKKSPTSNKKNPKSPKASIAPQPPNATKSDTALQTQSEPSLTPQNSSLVQTLPLSTTAGAIKATPSPKKPKLTTKPLKTGTAKSSNPVSKLSPAPKKPTPTNSPKPAAPLQPAQLTTGATPTEPVQPAIVSVPTAPEAETQAAPALEPTAQPASTTNNTGKKKVAKDFGWRYYPAGTTEANYLRDWLLAAKDRGISVHRKGLGLDERLLLDLGVKVFGPSTAHLLREVPDKEAADVAAEAKVADPLEAQAEGPVSLGKRLPSTSNGLAAAKSAKFGMMMAGGDGTRKILDVASSIEERLLKYGRLGEDDGVIKRRAHNNFDYYEQDDFIDDPDDPLVNQAMEIPSSRFDDFFCLRGNIDTLKRHKKLSERIGEVRLRNRETKAKKTEEIKKKREELQIRSLKPKLPKPEPVLIESHQKSGDPVPSEAPVGDNDTLKTSEPN